MLYVVGVVVFVAEIRFPATCDTSRNVTSYALESWQTQSSCTATTWRLIWSSLTPTVRGSPHNAQATYFVKSERGLLWARSVQRTGKATLVVWGGSDGQLGSSTPRRFENILFKDSLLVYWKLRKGRMMHAHLATLPVVVTWLAWWGWKDLHMGKWTLGSSKR